MYTATITGKEEVPQGLMFTVEFTDGTNTLTETVTPQDEDGLKYWVNSRLTSLNSIVELDTKYAAGVVLDFKETVPEKTPEEISAEQWFSDYLRFSRIKYNLIDTGIVDITHPKVQELMKIVQGNIKDDYFDKM